MNENRRGRPTARNTIVRRSASTGPKPSSIIVETALVMNRSSRSAVSVARPGVWTAPLILTTSGTQVPFYTTRTAARPSPTLGYDLSASLRRRATPRTRRTVSVKTISQKCGDEYARRGAPPPTCRGARSRPRPRLGTPLCACGARSSTASALIYTGPRRSPPTAGTQRRGTVDQTLLRTSSGRGGAGRGGGPHGAFRRRTRANGASP